ncbi:MAG: hypothetical protein ACRDJB_00775 [Actinomycetota bacterium]
MTNGGGAVTEMSSCERCGAELPARRLKEIVYEQGRLRLREMLCPSCLDKAMNESKRVRGVVGTAKAAAAHLDPGRGPAIHQSLGERKATRA